MRAWNVLRETALASAVAALFPLPLLLATDPAQNGDIKCLYLGLTSACLAAEIFRLGSTQLSRRSWVAKTIAVWIAIPINAALFTALGLSIGVKTHFPFPLMAALSAVPALGLVPGLSVNIRQPPGVIILGSVLVVGAKLLACDWRTAKLMITLFWFFAVSLSLCLLVAGYRTVRKQPDRLRRSRRLIRRGGCGTNHVSPCAVGTTFQKNAVLRQVKLFDRPRVLFPSCNIFDLS